MCTEPELIQSPLSRTIHRDGHTLLVDIYRLEEETDWLLEVVNGDGTSHVLDDWFPTDQSARSAVHEAIDEEGIRQPPGLTRPTSRAERLPISTGCT